MTDLSYSRTPGGQADAALIFPSTGKPKGFATLATTQWDGNPEPIVREMLQNSLDACVLARRDCCEVSFTIREVALEELPGIDDYIAHFSEVVEERSRGPQGPGEKEIIDRIEKVIERESVQILVCLDNGLGLTGETMSRLLTEGNTDKEDEGVGARGVGHLTAFAASDLRYVVYAGRHRDRRGGALVDVASTHAMLASRTVRDDNGLVGGRDASGFWLDRRGASNGAQLGLFDPTYPDFMPPLLDPEAASLPDTGTLVCVTGFNRFNDSDHPADAIARVSAKNFLVAIQRGKMVVRVRDETVEPARHHLVNDTELHTLLEDAKSQKRIRRGWLPGEQAYRCLRTLEEGEVIELACGARAQVRLLRSTERDTSSRVQLFRDGMWITNKADELTTSRFTGFNPFDAALMIERGDGEIEKLVRAAEGPEHLGLDRSRLGADQRLRLLRLLREIKEELQQHVGKVKSTDKWTPADFAVFGRRGGQTAEKAAPYVPKKVPEDVPDDTDDEGNVTTSGPSEDGEPGVVDDGPRGKGGKSTGRGTKPRAGRAIAGRSSVVADRDGSGRIHRLRAHWKPGTKPGGPLSSLGVRARLPSGSDETCELPLGPKWLKIAKIQFEDGSEADVGNGGFEAPIPNGEIVFTLFLAEPIADGKAVEIDVVGRTDAKAKSG